MTRQYDICVDDFVLCEFCDGFDLMDANFVQNSKKAIIQTGRQTVLNGQKSA